jgi:hypothetical protein
VDAGSTRKITATDGDGQRVGITAFFQSLTKPYRMRKPVSTRFWRKRGGLDYLMRRDVKPDALQVTAVRRGVPHSHHKGKTTIHMRMFIGAPYNGVISRYLVAPFVTGKERVSSADTEGLEGFSTRGLNRFDSEVLGYPEALGRRPRPFVARMAAALGRRAQTALRRLNFS